MASDRKQPRPPRKEDATTRNAEAGRIPLPARALITRRDLAQLYAAINGMRGTGGITVTIGESGIIISGAGNGSSAGRDAEHWQWFNANFYLKEVIICEDGEPVTIQVAVKRED